ncbi:MAG: lysoplasmalogenase [Spirochaetales bacterium]|uniref:Lysoplasmalogenase n=1 Tax=Candidatus Thalassospirochaeta sargassi TaxID=3119039 RepID=A0AAJ1ML12_9SPIO|nr:lysoplasmalogenase [Spirochaetales bacterium]
MITKPFWVPAITVIYLLAAETPEALILTALFFGWIGDLLLMRGRKSWFIAGAFSFLIGHIFYIIVFIRSSGGIEVFIQHPIFSILMLLPYIGFLLFMRKLFGHNVKSVLLAAGFYLSILMLMSYCSLMRVWVLPISEFLPTFMGSLLFIASDSLIGYRNFKRKVRGIGTLIVATYIAAQLLIITGLA